MSILPHIVCKTDIWDFLLHIRLTSSLDLDITWGQVMTRPNSKKTWDQAKFLTFILMDSIFLQCVRRRHESPLLVRNGCLMSELILRCHDAVSTTPCTHGWWWSRTTLRQRWSQHVDRQTHLQSSGSVGSRSTFVSLFKGSFSP